MSVLGVAVRKSLERAVRLVPRNEEEEEEESSLCRITRYTGYHDITAIPFSSPYLLP